MHIFAHLGAVLVRPSPVFVRWSHFPYYTVPPFVQRPYAGDNGVCGQLQATADMPVFVMSSYEDGHFQAYAVMPYDFMVSVYSPTRPGIWTGMFSDLQRVNPLIDLRDAIATRAQLPVNTILNFPCAPRRLPQPYLFPVVQTIRIVPRGGRGGHGRGPR